MRDTEVIVEAQRDVLESIVATSRLLQRSRRLLVLACTILCLVVALGAGGYLLLEHSTRTNCQNIAKIDTHIVNVVTSVGVTLGQPGTVDEAYYKHNPQALRNAEKGIQQVAKDFKPATCAA